MRLIAILALVSCVAVACSGGGKGGTFFEPKNADDLAHRALVEPKDLGTGWEVTAEDEFDDEDDDSTARMQTLPACSRLSNLSELEEVFGESDELPAGRAQVELSQTRPKGIIPASIEVEIEIEETESEISGVWGLVKEILESQDTKACMVALFQSFFSEDDASALIDVTMEPAMASAAAPQDGAVLAFKLTMRLARQVVLDGPFEIYLWPYGNAGVTAMFIGDKQDLTPELISTSLKAIDKKIVDTEKRQ